MSAAIFRKAALRRASIERHRKVLNKGAFKKTLAEGTQQLREAIEALGVVVGPQIMTPDSISEIHHWSLEDLKYGEASLLIHFNWLLVDYEDMTGVKGAYLTTYSPASSDAIEAVVEVHWKDVRFSINIAAAIPQDDIYMLTLIGVRRVNTRNSTSSHQETTYVCEV